MSGIQIIQKVIYFIYIHRISTSSKDTKKKFLSIRFMNIKRELQPYIKKKKYDAQCCGKIFVFAYMNIWENFNEYTQIRK